MMDVNDMVELIVRAAAESRRNREMKSRKTAKLSPAQAVMMSAIDIESRKPGTVDGWALIDDIVKVENHRTFVALIHKGYLKASEIRKDDDGVMHRFTKILKGP